jgi:hypothetical protein
MELAGSLTLPAGRRAEQPNRGSDPAVLLAKQPDPGAQRRTQIEPHRHRHSHPPMRARQGSKTLVKSRRSDRPEQTAPHVSGATA